MKSSIRALIGRTVTGVIVKQGGTVAHQVFLLFSDGTYFEFYSTEHMAYSGAIAAGNADVVRGYMADTQKIVIDQVWSERANAA